MYPCHVFVGLACKNNILDMRAHHKSEVFSFAGNVEVGPSRHQRRNEASDVRRIVTVQGNHVALRRFKGKPRDGTEGIKGITIVRSFDAGSPRTVPISSANPVRQKLGPPYP